MLEKWKTYQASEVQSGIDQNGNRLISLFVKDYKDVMGTEFCPSCKDFEIKFNNFITKLENMKTVKNSGFKLKAMFDNITLFGSTKYFNNATLSDEEAIVLLENHPKGLDLFDEVPEDWESLKTPAPEAKKKDTHVVLFDKNFTVDETKELFKTAGIETKASSVKGLTDKFAELSDDEKKAIEALVNPTPGV
jgi:hypothetical protein